METKRTPTLTQLILNVLFFSLIRTPNAVAQYQNWLSVEFQSLSTHIMASCGVRGFTESALKASDLNLCSTANFASVAAAQYKERKDHSLSLCPRLSAMVAGPLDTLVPRPKV